MLARELLGGLVSAHSLTKQSSVHAFTKDRKHWWHVHKDEEVPFGYMEVHDGENVIAVFVVKD